MIAMTTKVRHIARKSPSMEANINLKNWRISFGFISDANVRIANASCKFMSFWVFILMNLY